MILQGTYSKRQKPPCGLIRKGLCVFLYQLYSVNYPSLRDNNILRRVLVNEVMFWAENLKKRFVERVAEKDDAEHPAAVGAEMVDESAGEHHNVWHAYMILNVLSPIKSVCPV